MPRELPDFADFVVVGAGPAGSAAAAALAESEAASVLVLEAGPDYGRHDSGRWPPELLEAFDLAETHSWGYGSESTYPERVVDFARAKVIGGCSAHNGCAAIWGHRLDYDGWAAMGNPGWSTDELLPFFQMANQRMRVSIPSPAQITPFHQLMLESAAAIGIAMVEGLNDLDEPVGMAPSPANIHDGIRWNGAFAFLDPIRNQPNLTIVGDATVDRLILDGDRVRGVRVIHDDASTLIEAGTVVLAAGTYNSPMILLRSGIGPASDLRALGIDSTVDLLGVGENLHDHPAVYLKYAGSEALRTQMTVWGGENWLPEEQTIAKLRSTHCTEAFDLHIYPEGGPYADGRATWSFMIPVACMTPASRGSLRLRSSDPIALPLIDHRYLSDPDARDLAILLDGIEIGREIGGHANRHGLLGNEIAPGSSIQGDAALAEWTLGNVHHYFHAAGTCKMAPGDDPCGVVDAHGKVRGVVGAYVADCSIMPQVPRANTNIPAVVIGLRIASWLAAG